MKQTSASLFDALRPRYVTMHNDPKAVALLTCLATNVRTLVKTAERGRPPLEGLQQALGELGLKPGDANLSQLLGAATRVLMADAGFEPDPDGRGGSRTLEIRAPHAVQKRAVVYRRRGAAARVESPPAPGATLSALAQQLRRMEATMTQMQQTLDLLLARTSREAA